MLQAVVTTLLFALSGVCAARSSRVLGGTEANFWRITLATLLLGLMAHTLGSGLSGRAFPYFILSGCVGFGIGDLALYQALPRLGSRLSIMLVHCVAAPFAALLEWAWLGTSLTVPQFACAAVVLAGVALALVPETHSGPRRTGLAFGIGMGIVAGLGQGFGAVLSRKAYAVAELAGEPSRGFAAGITAAYQRILAGWLVAALSYALLHYCRQRRRPTPAAPPILQGNDSPAPQPSPLRRAAPWVVANALTGPSLGVAFFQWALTATPTAVVLPIVATTPIAIMPVARWLEGERPGRRSVAGGILAVIGVVLLTASRTPH